MRKLAAAALIAGSAIVSAPARTEEVYITGFGHIFSLGVCSIGPGRCISYLSVEGTIEDLCSSRPKTPIRVAGHSMGASAAIKLVNGVHACGLKVEAAAFLDPLTHPRAFGIPKGVRTMTLYSPGFFGAGEGHADAERYAGGHIMQAFDGRVHARVRALFDGKGG